MNTMKIWEKIKLAAALFLGWAAARWQDLRAELTAKDDRIKDMLDTQERQFRREIDHQKKLERINTDSLTESEISCLLSSEKPEECERSAQDQASSARTFREG